MADILVNTVRFIIHNTPTRTTQTQVREGQKHLAHVTLTSDSHAREMQRVPESQTHARTLEMTLLWAASSSKRKCECALLSLSGMIPPSQFTQHTPLLVHYRVLLLDPQHRSHPVLTLVQPHTTRLEDCASARRRSITTNYLSGNRTPKSSKVEATFSALHR